MACAVLLAGCGAAPGEPDAARDAAPPDPLSYCTAAIFEADGLPSETAHALGGDGACSSGQYPVDVATLALQVPEGTEDAATLVGSIEATCWRVTSAAPGSGWSEGEIVASTRRFGRIGMIGFERQVAFDGRAVRGDGSVVFSIPERTLAVDAPRVVLEDASDLVAVMGEGTWATRDELTAFGRAIPSTREIVDATLRVATEPDGDVIVLERLGADVFVHLFAMAGGALAESEIALGATERAVLAPGGLAVAIDAEVVLLERDPTGLRVARRVTLDAPPDELVAQEGWAVARVGERLFAMSLREPTDWSLEVGPGRLLASSDGVLFFDGRSLIHLDLWWDAPIELGEAWALDAEDLAHTGEPLFVGTGALVGRDGFALSAPWRELMGGPTRVTIADLFGGGTISLVSDDGYLYVVASDDGGATLYRVPHYDGPPVTCD